MGQRYQRSFFQEDERREVFSYMYRYTGRVLLVYLYPGTRTFINKFTIGD